ncbi:MAG: hypothetical protein FJX75_24655 [Armatimonadetes bacterium]|nr:hypothetical protein [Armatimonadota bacterium]
MRLACCCVVVLLLGSVCVLAAPIDVPVYPVPEDNAFDHYVQATKLFPEGRPWDEAAGDPEALDAAEAELIVLDAGAALEEFRLGLDKPCVMPGPVDFSTTFPYLADFRSLTRLLMVEAMVHLNNGDAPAAFGSYMDAIKLGQGIARNGPLIHKLVSIACESIALKQIRRSAPMAGDAKALGELIKRLESAEPKEVPLSETLAVEWDCTRRNIEAWKADPAKRAEIGQVLERPGLQMPEAMLDDALTQLKTCYAQMIAVAKTDYWRWTTDDLPVPKGNAFVEMILPTVAKTREKHVRHLANLRATLLAVALEIRFARDGAYPEKLSALSPEPLAALPVDPFSGNPFIYHRQGDLVYVLYSVGPNGVDDGGRPADAGQENGDILFSAVE